MSAWKSCVAPVMVALIVLLCPAKGLAERVTVLLKGGGKVSGTLVENAPGHHVTILTDEKEPFRIPHSQIDRVELDFGHSATPSPEQRREATPVPSPPPSPRPLAEAQGTALDVVELNSGRSIRGTIVQRNSRGGVRIRAESGEILTFSGVEIAYAGDASLGALHVEARIPGHAYVDDVYAGRVPIDVRDLEPSPAGHLVRVNFDGGGSNQERIRVQAARVTRVDVNVPASLAAAHHREGLSIVLGAGGFFSLIDGDAEVGGVQFMAGVNYGLTRRTDLRAVALGNVGSGSGDTGLEVGLRPSARFNLGSTYSMEVGARLGLFHYSPDTAFEIGPEVSFLSFRLGSLREYELTVWQAVPVAFTGGGPLIAFQTGLSVSYLYLD